ncbi:phage terminase large subunit family protein [Paenibacillus melissococcoides]|uniref:Phage terminase large subunit family protein n=1 Tax=Paenibacillus melissococcoides TaxID=2912268 RepID=A0ABN8U4L7_9BACL|nr:MULTISPECIES: phage terminase large subunit family protein [Paenibacillus]GIO78771.1 terminase [Paenibacillus dendritiformis]CAH8246035.1 phage terminase large subunit family protein [Paenibacillus melissococcoides]CAH8712779.1 phage terminase large subunit family protein [Paenibacillus melissococcoides]CAH8713548.1 phage terminase large subunit family protein [Paenibacillus melissococcoides]
MNAQRRRTLELLRDTIHLVAPPAAIGVDEWADEHRILSPEASAEPGPWNTDRAPYQREPMRAISDPNVESVVLMWGAQLGKTDIQLNTIGYFTGHDPSPIMVIQPDLMVARDFSNDRLTPMYRDSPQLSTLVVKDKSRDSRNTILYKSFPGGRINIAGANSPASLASKPIRVVIGDEVDRFPVSAGKEGDPVSLVTARTETFYNKKLIWVSTPTVKDVSKIEALYKDSTMEELHLPCPSCGELQILEWNRIKYEYDKETSQCIRVEHVCKYCGALHAEHEWKKDYAKNAVWIAQKKHATRRGFKLSSLYATINVTWKKIVNKWYEANRGGPELLKTFFNTVLAETWEEKGEQLDEDVLYNRREMYHADIPDGVKILTAAVDTQDDRFEVEVQGWGAGHENWRIQYHVIYGDLKQKQVWADLDKFLKRTWEDIYGNRFPIAITCMDSGGHFTNEVYRFCKERAAQRLFAIKGEGSGDGTRLPLIIGTSTNNRYRATVVRLGVDEGKSKVMSALSLPPTDEAGNKMPGYVHFPLTTPERNRGYERQYFEGLTAEELRTRYKMGSPYQVWVKVKPRNEPLDLAVYNRAAIEILQPNLDDMDPYCSVKAAVDMKPVPPSYAGPAPRRRRRGTNSSI